MGDSNLEELRAEVAQLRARVAQLQECSNGGGVEFFTALLRTLPAVVMRFDAHLRIRFLSRAVPGLAEEDVLGASALDFIPREDHDRALRAIDSARETGEPRSYETTGPGPNGERRPYQVFVAPTPDPDGEQGVCCVALDMSEVVARGRALAEIEQKLRIALTSVKLGLWTWDLSTNELIWDDLMRQMVGADEPLTLPDYIDRAVHSEDREMVRQAGERTLQSGHFESTAHRIVRPDGEVRWLLTLGEVECDAHGRVARLMGGSLDITEQRALEEQLRRAQKLEAVGRLTSGVAHNFNNMLMTVLPTLELLRPVVPESHAELLADAVGAAERGAEMVRKLMTFAGQRHSTNLAGCDTGALATRIVAMCERTFDRHIALSCDVSAVTPHVKADAADLEQVLMNLLLNARDAVLDSNGDRPWVRVTVTNEAAPGSAPDAPVEVVLRVADNGTGMSDLVMQNAFEPFFTSKGVGRGTGLGLATSYAIVRDLGGLIEIQSKLHVGTTVTIRLSSSPPPTEEVTTPPALLRNGGARVLVVDDEPLIRRVIEQALVEFGHRVRTAGDGSEALVELAREPAEVILLDRSMPGAPGSSIISTLRQLAPSARIAYFTGQEVTPMERAAVDAVIQKPIRLAELERVVAELAEPD